jgi:putative transposase
VQRGTLKLGFEVWEPTVSRWLRRVPRTPNPVPQRLTFLRDHREAITAMDFLTVPTSTYGVPYCFFVIGHDRRPILHCGVTRNPTTVWIRQQMREAWPYEPAHRFLLFDRDAKLGSDVVSFAKTMASKPTRTGFRIPWQNGVAERWVGSLSTGLAGSRDCVERTASEAAVGRLSPLLS